MSRVINNRGYVSDLNKRKVLGIIEELDYVPNVNAISLKKS
ncbi:MULTISPECIES: LacI family DNA-binding transcriptional regulator [unclassified Paenibacillus]|nr:LacI family DNA-binding transcriptional regulator [Paenibacillus sp. 37]